MSSGDASSMCAAYCLAFSRILPAALIAAVMPTDEVRDAVRAVAERRALRVGVLDDDVLHRARPARAQITCA